MTFGTLIRAQAFGDRKALKNAGRKVISFLFDSDDEKSVKLLTEKIKEIAN